MGGSGNVRGDGEGVEGVARDWKERRRQEGRGRRCVSLPVGVSTLVLVLPCSGFQPGLTESFLSRSTALPGGNEVDFIDALRPPFAEAEARRAV